MNKKNKLVLLLCIALAVCTCSVAAEMRPVKKIRSGVPPYQILKEIVHHNGTAAQKSSSHPLREEERHTPYITWLADSDDRVQTQLLLPQSRFKVYSVRNLANQLILSTGSVDYGVLYLHSPVLLITGNTDNQAIRLFMQGYEYIERAIAKELDHLHLPLNDEEPRTTASSDMPLELKILHNVERNVDFQVEQAVSRYKDRIRRGRLAVVGGVIDLQNLYGHGADRLVIINVNGEKDKKRLQQSDAVKTIGPKYLDILGRSIKQTDTGSKSKELMETRKEANPVRLEESLLPDPAG